MVFSIVAGLLFGGLGASQGFDHGYFGIVFVALGATFIVRGIFFYTRAARYPTPDKKV